MSALFGTAGSPESFYDEGHKRSAEMPRWLKEHGLDAFEYQCGRGVSIGEDAAGALGAAARENGITLSLHAPYFVNPANPEPESREKTAGYVLSACRAARWMGAGRVVVHTGALMKLSREEALRNAIDCFAMLRCRCDAEGFADILLCPETMGKLNQLGDLEEVLAICAAEERLLPCIDFGHLYARSLGALDGEAAVRSITERLEQVLGRERALGFHCHFSKIEFTPRGGEKRHLTFAQPFFGPAYEPLCRLLAEGEWHPTVICESAGTQEMDALAMKRCYLSALRDSAQENVQ